MRLEQLPILFGILVGILGLGLIVDGWLPDGALQAPERRRRARAERDRSGEVIVGLGAFALAAALMGRDTWRFTSLSVLIGVLLFLVGAVMNRSFLREALTFRGRSRRGRSADRPLTPPEPPPPPPRLRIR